MEVKSIILLCLGFIFIGLAIGTLEIFYNSTSSTDRKRLQNSFNCTLPLQLENGRWLVTEADVQSSGQIEVKTILRLECHDGYQLNPNISLHFCDSNWNETAFPTCKRVCPKPSLPSGTQIHCKNSKDQYIDCTDLADGSSITFTCPNGFISDNGTPISTRYCTNGAYGNSVPSCSEIKQKTVYVSPKTLINSTTPDSNSTNKDAKKVICTYASSMAYNGSYPENVEPRLCTHLIYQFIELSENGDLDLKEKGKDLLKMTRDLKTKNKNLKVLISVGGNNATDSPLKSLSMDNKKVESFISSATNIIQTYSLDGLDFYWIFPELDEKARYVNLLDEIKRRFEYHGWLLSVTVYPVLEKTGYDLQEINRIVDWVTIKSLDIYGTWLSYIGNSSIYNFSMDNYWDEEHFKKDTIVKSWLNAGLSKKKLIMGVEFYGISFRVKNKNQTDVEDPIEIGRFRYYETCSDFRNFKRGWDNATKTVYFSNSTFWIGFNDALSTWWKGYYVKQNELGGVAIFSIEDDDYKGVCGQKHPLLQGLHNGLGYYIDWKKLGY
ncbi:unnamed protein product [Diabrotica balteata]|uniref:Chitinase n=1 Tax=Diabrotica balteata TaxID=107213 RepID=A0A9N9T150_DIABA|nr:unnamed protein product [Diabrotica balteata]